MEVSIMRTQDGTFYVAATGERRVVLGSETHVLSCLQCHPSKPDQVAKVTLKKSYARRRLAVFMAKQIGTRTDQLVDTWRERGWFV